MEYYDPIVPGGRDVFSQDFVGDMGASAIVSTSWICLLAGDSVVVDPFPAARILLAAQVQGTISKCLVGDCVLGAKYVLRASVTTNETPPRILIKEAFLLCSELPVRMP